MSATLSLMLLASVLPFAAVEETAPRTVLWAGHQVSYGSRRIPFRGRLKTRSESLLLARVRFDGTRLHVSQVACAVFFDEVAGARVSVDADALPRSNMTFNLRADGEDYGAGSEVAWGAEDIDDDGHPGMTVSVDAPVCAGDLYVSNRSLTRSVGRFEAKRFVGDARVTVHQHVLGARGRCLETFADDTLENVRGPFAYVEVPAGTTCGDLIRKGWPVDAETPDS